ncbi:MAG: hypothetical protein KatS3mg015_0905 [Fimbriimonadales bacterium]|nr:MAG: hypothetical protein KatS3mg015_0905 [Fimbriimonadales bacterium]
MKRLKLLANENIDFRVVKGLRERGLDVVAMNEVGLANRALPDAAVLDIATAQQRAVLTLNHRDFYRLHVQRGGAHAGIVSITPDRDVAALVHRIESELAKHSSLARRFLRIKKS